ncbi:MAG: glycosyltransferase, partial [Deltaproteobacteria bacterium]|nr:glycosyltransferase [Deltaproteobacteria bacterium]
MCTLFNGTAGTATHLAKWARNLAKSEFDVVLVHGLPGEGRIASLFGTNERLRVVYMPELRRPDQLFLPGLVKLYRLLRRERPHIVHTILIQSDILGTIAAKLARIPVVVSSAEGVLFSRLTTTTAKMLVYRLGYRFIRNWLDAVIAISHFVGRELKDQFGVDPVKVRVVHLGLEGSDFSTAVNGKTALKRDAPVVGVVSTLVEGKGLEYLLMAIPAIVSARPDTWLCIVGDGPLRGRLSELAVRLGVGEAVKFCGWVSPVKEVMEGFDVVVMPSLQEGLSWV